MNQMAMEQTNIAELLSLDTEEPSTPIADVARIGGVDAGDDNQEQIGDASSDDLADKLNEYRTQGKNLEEHHAYMQERFNTLFADYVAMFSALDVLSSLNESIKVVLPNFQLQEEFSFFTLEGPYADLGAKISQVLFWGGVGVGGLASGAGIITSYQAWKASKLKYTRQSAKLITQFKGQVIPAAKLSKLSNLGQARLLKGLGVVGAVFGVVGAGMGIYATFQNEKLRREFLVSSVYNFQTWYDETRSSYDALAGGVDTMEENMREMMAILEVIDDLNDPNAITDANIDALELQLAEASDLTGKHAAKVKTAARIYCFDPTTSAATVANLTGLTTEKAGEIRTTINGEDGAAICAVVTD